MSPSPIGRWVVEDNPRAFLEFGEDGSLSGSDGANAIATTWSDGDQGILVEPSLSTLRAAPDMVRWVTRTRRVEPVGQELRVFDAADTHLGVLIRQPLGSEPGSPSDNG